MILEGEIKDAKMSSFSSDFQQLNKHQFPLYFVYEILMSLGSERPSYSSISKRHTK